MVQYDAGAMSPAAGGVVADHMPQVGRKVVHSRVGALLLKQYGGEPAVCESIAATPPAGEMSVVRKRWYLSAVPGLG